MHKANPHHRARILRDGGTSKLPQGAPNQEPAGWIPYPSVAWPAWISSDSSQAWHPSCAWMHHGHHGWIPLASGCGDKHPGVARRGLASWPAAGQHSVKAALTFSELPAGRSTSAAGGGAAADFECEAFRMSPCQASSGNGVPWFI